MVMHIFPDDEYDYLYKQFKDNLYGHARDHGNIPKYIIDDYLEIAMDNATSDPELYDAFVEDGKTFKQWPDDGFREFLFEYITICTDYPIE